MSSSSKERDYTGKKVFIGIDVHKRTYSVVCVAEGTVVKRWQTLASPEKLAQQLHKYFAGAELESVYEAGFSGFVLQRIWQKAGINNLVVNPGSLEVAIHNRVKTDKRDALKLATLLEAGRLEGIRIPSEKEFKNERQLFSYTGLTPSEHSSGDNIRRGHITRQGNSS